MSAVAQDAEKVAVDEGYLEHFARQALRAPKGEQEDAVRKLVESLIAKCQENAVFFEDQMKGLALLGQLNDVLGSIVIANLITERFDGQVSQERKKKPLRSFFFALAGSLQAMEAMCVNYGVCSALVLTMTFANFGAIGKGDWDAYMVNVMMDGRDCWGLHTCPNGGDICLRAAHLIADEPWMNLSTQAPPMDCCREVLQCGKDSLWMTNMCFTLGNGGGSACLLLVVTSLRHLHHTCAAGCAPPRPPLASQVLFSSWLYTSQSMQPRSIATVGPRSAS